MSKHTSPNAPGLPRRRFLQINLGLAATAVVPSFVLGRGGQPPSQRLNLICIGVGGRGGDNFGQMLGENIVGICDVDESRAVAARTKAPGARFHRDFRQLLDQVGSQADAVVVSTPDHTHAAVLMRAIQMGKHVYSEKPLAHSIHEVRRLREAARTKGVVTQLGNQGHATDSIRTFCEMVQDGALGTVREVHAFCGNSYRPRGFVLPPAETPPVPPNLDWDLWLGPAPARPYHPVYHPGRWRGWLQFGTGIIGDWTCHVLDPSFWALDLDAPTSITATAADYADARVRAETAPPGSVIQYEFPAEGGRPAVKVTWFDGNFAPPRPPELEPQRKMPSIGAVILGDRGRAMHGSHGAGGWQLLPKARNDAYQQPAARLPRSRGHHEEWIAACKGGPGVGSSFEYGGPLTEVALLGLIALRFPGQRLEWDARTATFPNFPAANVLVNPPRRDGWPL